MIINFMGFLNKVKIVFDYYVDANITLETK